MNILLLGYGKMGKAIEKIATEREHTIVAAVHDHTEVSHNIAVDVAIEFSAPESAFNNIIYALEKGIPVVSGTTGWLDKLPQIEAFVAEKQGSFFYASNYSLGVNLFFKLNKQLAEMMAKLDYRPEIEEIHHIHKLDAPSGTAITLAEGILEKNRQLTKYVNHPTEKANELPIISKRQGEVPGTHIITYKGQHDEIRIEHKAEGREGFALGALQVAEWIVGKKGMMGMEDFLE